MAKSEHFDFTKQPGHLLRKALQRNQVIYSRLCIDPSMTSVQFAVLYALVDKGPLFNGCHRSDCRYRCRHYKGRYRTAIKARAA